MAIVIIIIIIFRSSLGYTKPSNNIKTFYGLLYMYICCLEESQTTTIHPKTYQLGSAVEVG